MNSQFPNGRIGAREKCVKNTLGMRKKRILDALKGVFGTFLQLKSRRAAPTAIPVSTGRQD